MTRQQIFRKKSIYVIAVVLIVIFLPSLKTYRDCLYRISADFFYPFFFYPSKMKDSSEKKVYASRNKAELIDQVVKMQKTIAELEAKCGYLRSFKDENKELRSLLNIRPIPNFRYIIAEVMYRDPAKWYGQFTINKGTDAGVENGSLVLGNIKNKENERVQFGVVGRIGAVSKHTAVVYTILSDECQLSVKIPTNGATGILRGGERFGQKVWGNIFFLPKDFEYKEGSVVVSSGLTPLAPKGLIVGKLTSMTNESSNNDKLFSKAAVEPAVDMAHLDFILVLGKSND